MQLGLTAGMLAKATIRNTGLFLLVVVMSACFAGASVRAEGFDRQFRAWENDLDKIEARVKSGRTGSLEEGELRSTLQKIADSAAGERDVATKEARQVRTLLESLGPKPAEGAEPEPGAIRKQRQSLSDELAMREGQAKQAGLVLAKAEQLSSSIGRLSRDRLKDALFERTVSPLNYKAWVVAVPEAVKVFQTSFISAPAKWWSSVTSSPEHWDTVVRTFLLALLAGIAGWPLGAFLRKRYGRSSETVGPSYARRLQAGIAEGGGRALGPVLFVLLLGSMDLEAAGTMDSVVQAAARNLVLLFLGYALVNAAFTPRQPEWRLLGFGEEATRRLVIRLKLALVVFLVIDGIHRATSWATPSAELESVTALVFTLFLVPILAPLLGRRLWEASESPDGKLHEGRRKAMYPRLRAILLLVLVLLPFSALVGYPIFAIFLTKVVVFMPLLVGGLVLLRSVGRESLAAALNVDSPMGRKVRDTLALGNEDSTRLQFWLHVLVDFALLVVAGIALLPVLGLGADETAASVAKLLRGVQIGSYTFSLIDILLGIFLFSFVVLVTRLVQKALERHILPNLTRDKGVRAALKTAVGYLGVVIAALVGISTLGLDLTNLALIAGALSVGIGFGLQNVINNFVSGLILLAERPIKPGDWVVIGGHEGKVKKVNVRSTEVETFQRASVIIPNADLISTPVINWTHKNMLGRVEVAVGVAYGTDPRLVEQVLVDCANAHPNVLKGQDPYVLFTNFGESSLDFELRAFLVDVEKRVLTGSELRFAIHDALKEKGIEIPFPQRVIHMAAPPA
ncbi:MAG: DUF3772 domain-containing protein [Rhodospirillales bacterium]|nr:DUF3772 domain-containing protein [Rhodospirillales bacterium]